MKNKKVGQVGIVFIISTIFVALFVLWGAISPSSLNEAASTGLSWMITNFGWFYMLITALFVLFAIVIAISPYGKIKLGKPDDRPEYSWISWIGMLFAAGIGVGFVFWGVAEPVLYFMDPPLGYEPGSRESALAGLRYGSYHWAMHPWAIFSIVGMTLAYVQYRKDRPALISSAFYPLLGDRVNGWAGKTIDTLAVIATCTGVATTFGLSAMQITGGLSYVTPIPNNAWVQLLIISIVTLLFMFSAVRGLDRGIKILSNINLAVAGLLLIFVLIVGPTLFIAENFVTTLGGYITNVIPMALTLTPFSESEWLGTNTIFFWAWHISWAPFMGIFIARISKGRTIREFMAGVLIVPSLLAIIWFTTFGGTGLNIEMYGAGGLAELINSQVELALFAMLAELPLSLITSTLAIILILIFFITSADSASFVLGSMTSNGDLEPKNSVKLIWGFLIAGAASVLLFSGGGGLDALQTASIIAALPFAIVMVLMIISLLITLGKDWKIDRNLYRKKRVNRVKGEFKKEFTKDIKEDVYDEVKSDLYEEMKTEMYEEVKDKIYDEIKEEIKEDLHDKK
ncbi:BCCT family transporter [Gracilibacillus xinjiangensis]|uniref:BCCT family transporter n=1 Tax=Gracilibacillus xinjiangensis TaxID=1193282 RepID=A0ABV8WWZ9_9BACI